jgi:hypothetical protein
VETLRGLTDQLIPRDDRALWHAVCACEAGVMRSTIDVGGALVSNGGIGSWREELPAAVKQMLATQAPFPDQLAGLGYTMDESHPDNLRLVEPTEVGNPFQGRITFANGVALAPILLKAYFDLPKEKTAGWKDATGVGPGTFSDWLIQPAAADPRTGAATPVVTELAHYLRSLRLDLRQAFPDPFGVNRVEFCHWFIFNGPNEFGFDRSLTFPVLGSWARGQA